MNRGYLCSRADAIALERIPGLRKRIAKPFLFNVKPLNPGTYIIDVRINLPFRCFSRCIPLAAVLGVVLDAALGALLGVVLGVLDIVLGAMLGVGLGAGLGVGFGVGLGAVLSVPFGVFSITSSLAVFPIMTSPPF